MSTEMERRGGEPATGVLRVGTWNISHWSRPKAERAAFEVPFDILAVQETHLASVPLEHAHTTAKTLELHLHHGRPVPASGHSIHGRACGVGFLVRRGLAVTPALPMGAAGRRLHAMGRWHAIRVAPRPDLPHGLLLASIYAPLESTRRGADRMQWNALMLEHLHGLDMQIPTLLLGDFNGSVLPERDYLSSSGARRAVCSLLAQLLGPGGAWLDTHATLLPEPLPWTFQLTDTGGKLSASRIDLILANRAALALLHSPAVHSEVRDGGHSPALVSLQLRSPTVLCWQRPTPRVPPLLRQPSAALRGPDWEDLIIKWRASPSVTTLFTAQQAISVEALSRALVRALHHLVKLAGGWETRPTKRRLAYDSNDMRQARRQLAALHRLEVTLRRTPDARPGSWPWSIQQQLAAVSRLGLSLPSSSLTELLAAVLSETTALQATVRKLHSTMRQVRHTRWRDALPMLWRDRPGAIYRYLEGARPLWGEAPIMDAVGMQCTSPAAVDAAVRAYWVDEVLRKDAAIDPTLCWTAFLQSPFGPFIPTAVWPRLPWSAERVRTVLHKMRESAAPGPLGIPISVWRALPEEWMAVVGRLLTLVEEAGSWPDEWLDAYVTMIPKSAGGTRPRDQRPITVLDLVYRIWAKGIVLEWADTLQHQLLGPAAMGFRREHGTLHLAQLLNDFMLLRRRQRQELWLASFDIQKCYDSLPWWALFGVLRQAGVQAAVVRCFEAFYQGLRRRFRYGHVLGKMWQAANGLAQGCPASPDLLNLLFEPFHRWAAAQNFGVDTAVIRVASVSFADDVVLLGGSFEQIAQLITAYLEWCKLLSLTVTKVQLWSSLGPGQQLTVGSHHLVSQSTFKVVGVVLGLNDLEATSAHTPPRLAKAMTTARRLRGLPLPAALCGLLWRTTVLPQALYGCELRNISPSSLTPLTTAAKALMSTKPPLSLNVWRSPAVLMGPPLGDTAIREPLLEMRERQLRWLQLICNSLGPTGIIHRLLSWADDHWQEPTRSLATALQSVTWSVHRNMACLRSAQWPLLDPEMTYPGPVELQPQDTFPMLAAVFTDGSLSTTGGAAAVCIDEDTTMVAHIPKPRSSTHCELVALCLAMQFSPPQILTDSLVSLQLVRRWGSRTLAQVLACPDRPEVRQFLHMVASCSSPPLLEKVKAHNLSAIDLGHPKAIGNDVADQAAKRAASLSSPVWAPPVGLFADAVQLLDSSGNTVLDVREHLTADWWRLRRRQFSDWKTRLFPTDVDIDWAASCGIFRRPLTSGGEFIHRAPRTVIKWTARIRCGCLATRERLTRHKMVDNPSCPCCLAPVEDDEHLLAGCPATGTADWLTLLEDAWHEASSGLAAPPPPRSWLTTHRLLLLAAMIPVSIYSELALPAQDANRFTTKLHVVLAALIAERLRRREALIATSAPADTTSPQLPPRSGVSLPCPLPPERQLSPRALRALEVQRRSAPTPVAPTSSSSVPPSGEPRQRWLRARLSALIRSDTEPCPVSAGATAVTLLELFERLTAEPFTDTPGAPITSRVRSVAKVLGNITRDEVFDPPLRQSKSGSLVRWNRIPRQRVDVVAWRRRMEEAERHSLAPPRVRTQMADVDAGLAMWIRQHPYLRPVEPAVGESGMALLLLWEVDHGMTFPTAGSADRTVTLMGFTRRLQRRVREDPELSGWLRSQELQQPLAPGLTASHHFRWGLSITAPSPGEPAGWYTDFTSRWTSYLATQSMGQRSSAADHHTSPSAAGPAASSSSDPQLSQPPPATRRSRAAMPASAPKGRQRQRSPPSSPQSRARPCQPAPPPPSRRRTRDPATRESADAPPAQRQRTLRNWFTPASQSPASNSAGAVVPDFGPTPGSHMSPEDEHDPRQTRQTPRFGDPRITPSSEDISGHQHPRRHGGSINGTAPSTVDGYDPRQYERHGDLEQVDSPAHAAVPQPGPGHSRAEQGPPT